MKRGDSGDWGDGGAIGRAVSIFHCAQSVLGPLRRTPSSPLRNPEAAVGPGVVVVGGVARSFRGRHMKGHFRSSQPTPFNRVPSRWLI